MQLEVTETAGTQIQKALSQRASGVGLRVAIKTSGCSGLAYVIEFVDAPQAEDLLLQNKGVKIYIDPKSKVYLNGTVLDFIDNGIESGFAFRNPNEKARCGCGESFTV